MIQILFEKKPVSMTMHEKQFSDCQKHSILRVYNGWIYSTYITLKDGQSLTSTSSVFVPMHKNRSEKE